MFCPEIKPACWLQRNAQVAPNSSGSPNLLAAMVEVISALASSRLIFFVSMSILVMKICRSVSNLSGKRLLIVTLSTATCLEIPLEKAVKPALAEVERPIKGCGDLTIAEVILMILPNFL
ncbi:uncharacterized protein METZ01_LOCUS123921, partial [marine metagenome]